MLKQFHGALTASSDGEMLSAMTAVQAPAGYGRSSASAERCTGAPRSFLLQLNGIMRRGTPQLTVSVVPDSDRGELSDIISGAMELSIQDGKNFYTFGCASRSNSQEKRVE